MNPSRMRLFLAVAFLVLAAPALAQDSAVSLAIRDHQFVPAELSIAAGTKVQLTVRNEQTMPAEFESNSLHREKIVAPGSSVSLFVGPLNPGRYEFFDDFHPQTRGFLTVK